MKRIYVKDTKFWEEFIYECLAWLYLVSLFTYVKEEVEVKYETFVGKHQRFIEFSNKSCWQ
jgi:hypothetical protein